MGEELCQALVGACTAAASCGRAALSTGPCCTQRLADPLHPAGAVKVTAFDRLSTKPLAPGTCDVLVLGAGAAGVGLESVPLDRLPAVVLAALSGSDAAAAAGPDAQTSDDVADTVLVVCSHVARDERCGHIGPALADKLAELAGSQAPAGGMCVLKSSHIGGHKASCVWVGRGWHGAAQFMLCVGGRRSVQFGCAWRPIDMALYGSFPAFPGSPLLALQYAGNVIAYMRRDGTFQGNWFGGLHPGNAEEFLAALLACKVCVS